MAQFVWKSSQLWRSNGRRKRRKFVKFKPTFGISWHIHGLHAWPHAHCPSDSNVQDWDNFTHYPAMPWVYVLEELGASHEIARPRENSEKIRNMPRSTYNPIATPGEDTSLVRITRRRRYATARTIRHLWNLGQRTATRTIRNRPWKTDCTQKDLTESHYWHNDTERW